MTSCGTSRNIFLHLSKAFQILDRDVLHLQRSFHIPRCMDWELILGLIAAGTEYIN